MLLFKYQAPGVLPFAMLRRGEIFFASPSELNDAHEFRPQLVLNGSVELWQRLAQYILVDLVVAAQSHNHFDEETSRKVVRLADKVGTVLKKKLRSKDLEIGNLGPLFVEVITPLLADLFNKRQIENITRWILDFVNQALPGRLLESHYVACFSLNAINPTMWGHYANAEKGFVIVYTTENNTIHVHSTLKILNGTRPSKEMEGVIEIGEYSDEHLQLKPVKYRRKPPKVNAFHQLIGIFYYSELEDHYDVPLNLPCDAAKKEEGSLGLIKFSDWRFEQEIRVLFPLIAFRKVLCPDARVLRVSGENVCGLIFGPKMSPEDKERAVTCCYMMRQCQADEAKNDFAFFQAEQQHDKYSLHIKPLGILDIGFYHPGFSQLKPMDKLSDEQVRQLTATAEAIMNDVVLLKGPSAIS